MELDSGAACGNRPSNSTSENRESHNNVLRQFEVMTERDRLVIRIFGDCGLLLAELTPLRIHDVIRSDWGAVLDVDGKGRRQHRVPLAPAVFRCIERHIRGLKSGDPEQRPFCLLHRNRFGEYEPLTEKGVSQLARWQPRTSGRR